MQEKTLENGLKTMVGISLAAGTVGILSNNDKIQLTAAKIAGLSFIGFYALLIFWIWI